MTRRLLDTRDGEANYASTCGPVKPRPRHLGVKVPAYLKTYLEARARRNDVSVSKLVTRTLLRAFRVRKPR